jgi:hypothetical protein
VAAKPEQVLVVQPGYSTKNDMTENTSTTCTKEIQSGGIVMKCTRFSRKQLTLMENWDVAVN